MMDIVMQKVVEDLIGMSVIDNAHQNTTNCGSLTSQKEGFELIVEKYSKRYFKYIDEFKEYNQQLESGKLFALNDTTQPGGIEGEASKETKEEHLEKEDVNDKNINSNIQQQQNNDSNQIDTSIEKRIAAEITSPTLFTLLEALHLKPSHYCSLFNDMKDIRVSSRSKLFLLRLLKFILRKKVIEEQGKGDMDPTIPLSCFLFSADHKDFIKIPTLDWSKIRGYTFACQVFMVSAHQQPNNLSLLPGLVDEKKIVPPPNHHRFLFIFSSTGTNDSMTTLPEGGGTIEAYICEAGSSEVILVIKARQSNDSLWNAISKRIHISPNKWQHIAISHSLPFIRQSRIRVYVNGQLEFSQPLPFPQFSPTKKADVCSIGSGFAGLISEPTLIEGELPEEEIQRLYHFHSQRYVDPGKRHLLKTAITSSSSFSSSTNSTNSPPRSKRSGSVDVEAIGSETSSIPASDSASFGNAMHDDPRITSTTDGMNTFSSQSKKVLNDDGQERASSPTKEVTATSVSFSGVLESSSSSQQVSLVNILFMYDPITVVGAVTTPALVAQLKKSKLFGFSNVFTGGACPEITFSGLKSKRDHTIEATPVSSASIGSTQGPRFAQLKGEVMILSQDANDSDFIEQVGGIRSIICLLDSCVDCDAAEEDKVSSISYLHDLLYLIGDLLQSNLSYRQAFRELNGFSLIGYALSKAPRSIITASVAQAVYHLFRTSIVDVVSELNHDSASEKVRKSSVSSSNVHSHMNRTTLVSEAFSNGLILFASGLNHLLLSLKVWEGANEAWSCMLHLSNRLCNEYPILFRRFFGVHSLLDVMSQEKKYGHNPAETLPSLIHLIRFMIMPNNGGNQVNLRKEDSLHDPFLESPINVKNKSAVAGSGSPLQLSKPSFGLNSLKRTILRSSYEWQNQASASTSSSSSISEMSSQYDSTTSLADVSLKANNSSGKSKYLTIGPTTDEIRWILAFVNSHRESEATPMLLNFLDELLCSKLLTNDGRQTPETLRDYGQPASQILSSFEEVGGSEMILWFGSVTPDQLSGVSNKLQIPLLSFESDDVQHPLKLSFLKIFGHIFLYEWKNRAPDDIFFSQVGLLLRLLLRNDSPNAIIEQIMFSDLSASPQSMQSYTPGLLTIIQTMVYGTIGSIDQMTSISSAEYLALPDFLYVWCCISQRYFIQGGEFLAEAHQNLMIFASSLREYVTIREQVVKLQDWQNWFIPFILPLAKPGVLESLENNNELDNDRVLRNSFMQIVADILVLLLATASNIEGSQHPWKSLLDRILKQLKRLERVVSKSTGTEVPSARLNAAANQRAHEKFVVLLRFLLRKTWRSELEKISQGKYSSAEKILENASQALYIPPQVQQYLSYTMELLDIHVTSNYPNLVKLYPLTVGGTLTSSSFNGRSPQDGSANKTYHSFAVFNLMDNSNDTCWLDIEHPQTPNLGSKRQSWVSYKYPPVDENSNMPGAHRIVYYVVRSAADRPELDPTGWTLLGRLIESSAEENSSSASALAAAASTSSLQRDSFNSDDMILSTMSNNSIDNNPKKSNAEWVVLDKRMNIKFSSRCEDYCCWIQQTGFFSEYKIVFDPPTESTSTFFQGPNDEKLPVHLQVGNLQFCECNAPSWYLDSGAFLDPHNMTEGNSKELQSLDDESNSFLLEALSIIKVLRTFSSRGAASSGASVGDDLGSSISSSGLPTRARTASFGQEVGEKVMNYLFRYALGITCHVLPVASLSLSSQCVNLVKSFLDVELSKDTQINRLLVLRILGAYENAIENGVNEKSKELVTTHALDVIRSFNLEDHRELGNPFGEEKMEKTDESLEMRVKKHLMTLKPMISNAVTRVLKIEWESLRLHLHNYSLQDLLLIADSRPQHSTLQISKNLSSVNGDKYSGHGGTRAAGSHPIELFFQDQNNPKVLPQIQNWLEKHSLHDLQAKERRMIEENLKHEKVSWRWKDLVLQEQSNLLTISEAFKNQMKLLSSTKAIKDPLDRHEDGMQRMQQETDCKRLHPSYKQLWKIGSFEEYQTFMRRRLVRYINGNPHIGTSSGLNDRQNRQILGFEIKDNVDEPSNDSKGEIISEKSKSSLVTGENEQHLVELGMVVSKNLEKISNITISDNLPVDENEGVVGLDVSGDMKIEGQKDEFAANENAKADASKENEGWAEIDEDGEINELDRFNKTPPGDQKTLLSSNDHENKNSKMSLEKWINRKPSALRGEHNGPWPKTKGEDAEKILIAARCVMVQQDSKIIGRLIVSTQALYFDPDPPGSSQLYYHAEQTHLGIEDVYDNDMILSANGKQASNLSKSRLTGIALKASELAHTRCQEEKIRRRRRVRWDVSSIDRVLMRRYRMLDSAIELFFLSDSMHNGRAGHGNRRSCFLHFPNAQSSIAEDKIKGMRDIILTSIIKVIPRRAQQRSQAPGKSIWALVEPYTRMWQAREISNFEYLIQLNLLAGRSFHDLTQYPVFPWVLSDYTSDEIDLKNPQVYRDLTKPMGAVNPKRLEEFRTRYECFEDPIIPKFMYGSHYSTMFGVVLYFLVRCEPFTSLHISMQDGHFDVPDRLFSSVAATWNMCTTMLSEVKELTPEFYYLPEFLRNSSSYDLGTLQDGRRVDDVTLPPWAKGSPEKFVHIMREALESNYVSRNLHSWIDLIFGCKQRGKAAVESDNVFYYLTYPGAVDLNAITDPAIRIATEMQVSHFGQCPAQLLRTTGHPQRGIFPLLPQPLGLAFLANGGKENQSVTSADDASTALSPESILPMTIDLSPIRLGDDIMVPVTGGNGGGSSMASAATAPYILPDVRKSRSNNLVRRRSGATDADEFQVVDNVRSLPAIIPGAKTGGVPIISTILPLRCALTVNENGIIHLFNWGLSKKDDSEGDADYFPAGTNHWPSTPRKSSESNLSSASSMLSMLPLSMELREISQDEIPNVSVAMAPSLLPSPYLFKHASTLSEQDNTNIDVAIEGDIAIKEFKRRKIISESTPSFQTVPCAWNENGRLLITCGFGVGTIELSLLDTHSDGHIEARATLNAHNSRITTLALDGTHLVSGSEDGTIKLWQLHKMDSFNPLSRPSISTIPAHIFYEHESLVRAVAVSEYLEILVSSSFGKCLIHSTTSNDTVSLGMQESSENQLLQSICEPAIENISLIRISDRSSYIILHTLGADLQNQSKLWVYTINGRKIVDTEVKSEEGVVRDMMLSHQGSGGNVPELLLCCGDSGILTVRNLFDLRILTRISFGIGPLRCLNLVKTEEAAIVGAANGSVAIAPFPNLEVEGPNVKIPKIGTTDVTTKLHNVGNAALSRLDKIRGIASTSKGIAGEAIVEGKKLVATIRSFF